MTVNYITAALLGGAVLVGLVRHLRACAAHDRRGAAAWRACMLHPYRAHVQWPWRPYDHAKDGL